MRVNIRHVILRDKTSGTSTKDASTLVSSSAHTTKVIIAKGRRQTHQPTNTHGKLAKKEI